jgi:hypothetical protein
MTCATVEYLAVYTRLLRAPLALILSTNQSVEFSRHRASCPVFTQSTGEFCKIKNKYIGYSIGIRDFAPYGYIWPNPYFTQLGLGYPFYLLKLF